MIAFVSPTNAGCDPSCRGNLRAKKEMLPLSDILTSGTPRSAIFTTFELGPTLFDGHIARQLLAAGCKDLLLFTDQGGYEALCLERAALTHAGTSYWVCPVDLSPLAFHPKVVLQWSESQAKLFVMSANMT